MREVVLLIPSVDCHRRPACTAGRPPFRRCRVYFLAGASRPVLRISSERGSSLSQDSACGRRISSSRSGDRRARHYGISELAYTYPAQVQAPNESDRNGAPRYLTLRVRVLGSSSSPVRRTPRGPQLTTQPRMIRESKRQLSKKKR